MKTTFCTMALFAALFSYAQLQLPAQSPMSVVKQKIGLTEIEITYSRPSARGRVIFGEDGLLPLNEMWRVGANNATKVTFSKNAFLAGKPIDKGSYAILAIPGDTSWKLFWYPYASTDWNDYVEKIPVLELELQLFQNETYIESLDLRFQELTMDSCSLWLSWERTLLKIPINVEEEEVVNRNISRTLSGPSIFDYYRSALYLHETQTTLEKALEYIQAATRSEAATFFMVTREAMILKDLGKEAQAKLIAKKALQLSEKAGNKDFIRINQKIIAL